jgi:hypothetical protein
MGSSTSKTLVEGLVAGLIGYFAVALFFMAVNTLSGQDPFHTAAVLGTVLVGNVSGNAGAVIAFNGLHMIASLVVGIVAAWLLYETELHPGSWFAPFFFFVAGFIFTSVFAGVVASELSSAAPWWAVISANAVAGALAGWYLWTRHPGLGEAIQHAAES